MDTTADHWMPSKVSLDRDLPVTLSAPFASIKQENYYMEDATRRDSRACETEKSRDPGKINSADNGTRILANENSSIIGPVRINHRAQIDVIEVREDESNVCKRVLIYEEQHTKFIVLKALESDEPREVANELVDIVTTIGAPRIIQSGNGRVYAEQVVREIRLLLRDFCVVHGDATRNGEDRRDFKVILKSWMKSNPGRSFSEALRIVQVAENTTANSRNGKIPSQLFFGRNICEDLRRTIGRIKEGSKSYVSYEDSSNARRNNLFANDTPESPVKIEINDEPTKSIKNTRNLANNSNKSPNTRDNVSELESDEEKLVVGLEKYLRCDICEKQYTRLGHLKNHMKTHTRIGNFKCTMCNKSFRLSCLREKHTRRSHERDRKSMIDEKDENDRVETKKEDGDRDNREKRARLTDERSEEISTREKSVKKLSPGILGGKRLKNSKSRKKYGGGSTITKLDGNNLLECTYCEQKFNFPSILKRHVRSHTNERPYVCKVCNKSFKQLGHLSQHSLTHTDYRSFQCTVCSIKFDSLDALKLHSDCHKDEAIYRSKETYRLFECDICKKVFTTKSVLERHIFTHTHERKFSCKVCGKRFKQAGHVKSHMLVHTGERKFACTICAKRFSLSNSLKKHMYVHNGEKPYQCDVCGSRFLEKRNLNGHLMTHTNERPFSCKICGKRYTLADTLRRHVSSAHEDGRTYQCEICAKMFKQLAHLSVHKKVHNDERPFQCHLCEKNFKHKNVLKSHLAIHANVRPFECDLCKATFVRKTNLQTHIASSHMNERPHVCKICNKRFKQTSHLNGHIVVHSNSMPYQCDFCDRRCNRLDNLKKHMRLHAKNKE